MVVRKNEGDPRRVFVRGRRVVCDSRSRRVVRDSRSRRVVRDSGSVFADLADIVKAVKSIPGYSVSKSKYGGVDGSLTFDDGKVWTDFWGGVSKATADLVSCKILGSPSDEKVKGFVFTVTDAEPMDFVGVVQRLGRSLSVRELGDSLKELAKTKSSMDFTESFVMDSRSRRVKDDRGDVVAAFNSVIDLVGGSDIVLDRLVDYLSSDDLEGFIRHTLKELDADEWLDDVDLKEYGLDGFIKVADGVSRNRRVVRDSRSHRFMVRDNRHRVLKRVHDSRRRLVRDSQEDEDAKVWVDEDVKLVWGLASKGFQPDWSKSRVEILEDAKAFAEEKGVKDSADAPRADFIFPADSSVVNDGKGHYPLNSVARGRAALSYVARAKKLPDWYSGDMSLEEFKKHVQDTVQKAFPSIKVNVSDSSLSDDKMLEILSGTPSEDDCIKVARELRRQGRVSLRDADRKEVIAVGEFQDGSPIYSYKQRAWKSYTA